MQFDLVSLNGVDAWNSLVKQWAEECERYEDEWGELMSSGLSAIEEAALSSSHSKSLGPDRLHAYGLGAPSGIVLAFRVTHTHLPGVDGKFLRVRHVILSPHSVAEVEKPEDLGGIYAALVRRLVDLADGDLPADHLKIHFKSLTERSMSQAAVKPLLDDGRFQIANLHGAWLELRRS